jgi:hypothetical protein
VKLAEDDDFDKARRALFNYVDGLVIDERTEAETKRSLAALERDYNEAVRQFVRGTRKHRVVTLIPQALGSLGALLGLPFSGTAGGAVKTVAGRFFPAPADPKHPGKALGLIHAAFREPAMAV